MLNFFINLLARLVLRRPVLVSVVGTVLALVGSYYSTLLYKNLRPDMEELLPASARSVVDLGTVTQRLDSIETLVVLVFSKETQASKRFVIDLAEKLDTVPKDLISSVEYRIDRELAFFKDRRALFMELGDLERIRDFIRERISYEKQLYNPLNIFRASDLPEPRLDFDAIVRKYAKRSSGFDHFPEGFYATEDESVRAITLYMPGRSSDIVRARAMKAAIEANVKLLDPKSYAADIEVKYTGNIQNLIEESDALLEDLELSTVIVVVLTTIAMLAFYRSFRATLALILSLFWGTFWTFGASYFLVGNLNANSAFMASIVIGNGINYGIILLARYLEERRLGKNNMHATWIALRKTAGPTLAASFAAGLAYGSLILTDFRGFKQFGVIGLIGMFLCWLSAYVLLPSFLTLLDRLKTLAPAHKTPPKPVLAEAVARGVARFPRAIFAASMLAVAFSAVAIFQSRGTIIEMDMNKLRDQRCLEQGSGALYHYIHDIFRRYLSPVVILPRDRESSRKIAANLKSMVKMQGESAMIESVQTLDDFVPQDQTAKVAVLNEIQRLLPPRILARLNPKDQKLVGELLVPQAMTPFSEKELSPLIRSKFTERTGAIGNLVLINNKEGRAADKADELMKYVSDIRATADAVEPGAPVAGVLPITADMITAIVKDGPKATVLAFIAVILLVTVLFRNTKTILLCLFALCIGNFWLAGLIFHFDIKINFLNFVALPITFGIGVDYGVNVFQRYREEGSGSIINVVRNTGGAVALASLTTIIGYGSLLIAGNQAFVSFGLLAVLGELTCVFAAVVTLPAFLRSIDSTRARRKNTARS
jgi:predicted RND superfamily exporter protein